MYGHREVNRVKNLVDYVEPSLISDPIDDSRNYECFLIDRPHGVASRFTATWIHHKTKKRPLLRLMSYFTGWTEIQ